MDHKMGQAGAEHEKQLKARDARIATLEQKLDGVEAQCPKKTSPRSVEESVGQRWDQIEAMRQQLVASKNELSQLGMKLRMSTLDQEQEVRKLQCEHQLELGRVQWEHEQAVNALQWQHKQAVGALSPDRDRLKAELENVTHRLIASQDEQRQLRAELNQSRTKNNLQLTLAKEHYHEQIQKMQAQQEEHTPGSPMGGCRCNVCMDNSVSMVFGCGHAKCSDCANRLIGLGRGCPDCRAPLDEPRLLFLSVG
eukprot:TRINITY_DN45_c0_g1_i3.p2 TRINITY_DN45_c0_g1~~TRINITY_DN45_c0_g1_i3.p2  ORF type:complete len:252 (-),score=77.13 TRINITY_DN45_c0_g1_i3:438-1193(-)